MNGMSESGIFLYLPLTQVGREDFVLWTLMAVRLLAALKVQTAKTTLPHKKAPLVATALWGRNWLKESALVSF